MEVVYQSSRNIIIEEVENKNLGVIIIAVFIFVAIALLFSAIIFCFVWDQKKINEKRSKVIKLQAAGKKAKIGIMDSDTHSFSQNLVQAPSSKPDFSN